ncbi:hypothetical protein [Rhizobium sp. LjRoot258]|uniref:hypothetical protein n=1 Tax=Rhizobium sp. LjRoot258 TaxID=3342299 RepID=UPI003ED098C6
MIVPGCAGPREAQTRAQAAVRQIKAFIKRPDTDCGCSSVVGEVLGSLTSDELGPVLRELFVASVRQRTKVLTLAELLNDLDQLSEASDRGEIDEAIMLFEDMADQAKLGAQFLRSLAQHSPNRRLQQAGDIDGKAHA